MSKSSGKKKDHSEHGEEDHEEEHDAPRHAEHVEEGEPWLVSYADLMTLLFGFFVVMYSFAAKQPKAKDCVRLKLLEAFQSESPDDGSPTGGSTEGAAMRSLQMLVTMLNLDSVEDLMNRVQKETEKPDKNNPPEKASEKAAEMKEKSGMEAFRNLVGADDVKNLITIAIPADVLFELGSTELSPASKMKMQGIAKQLRTLSDIEEIEIVGHTDSSQSTSATRFDNWTLSVIRASAVGRVLTASGIPETRLRITGKGSAQPLLPEKTSGGKVISENMRKNRRIDIIVRRDKTSAKSIH